MPGITSVAAEFDGFSKSLKQTRGAEISCIAHLNNGFEGWVKLEFYLWLIAQRKLCGSDLDQERDVGLEYKVALDQRHEDMDLLHKQCDLWIRSETKNLYHYVEIKAPFATSNRTKMMTSAAHDYWYMSRIRRSYEQAASGNVIVMGVGFDDAAWRQGKALVQAQAGLPEDMEWEMDGSLDDQRRVRWAVLTKHFC